MLSVIIGTVSLVLIVTTGVIFYYRDEHLKKDTQTKMQGLVDQINDSHYYEYKFDKKQDQNVKNIDQNVTQVYDSVVKLQNNVKFIEQNTLLKDDTKKQFNTDKANIGTLKANRTTIANNTGKNNIVIEGGRTLDGNNEGWSAINFNGYYDNGEKRIDGNKGRFRLISDQRAGADNMVIDQWDKNNNWHQYMMMADGTVGINDNKLRFSNKWSGFPDNATDQSEISNDSSDYKKLMIVGNKSAGAERRVGVWDRLDVHGALGVDNNIKIRHNMQDWTNQSALTSWTPDGSKAGPSFGGPNYWSHFPWFDGNTYIRPGKAGGDINIDNANVARLSGNRVELNGPVFTPGGINVQNGDPGPLVEKRYNWSDYGDRYGVGQFPRGQTKMYTATNYPGNASISLARKDGSFDDIVTVNPDRSTNINGALKMRHNLKDWTDNAAITTWTPNASQAGPSFGGPNNWSHFPWFDGNTYIRPGKSSGDINIDNANNINLGANRIRANGNISTPNGHTIQNDGRQHIYTGEILYLLPNNGVQIGREWGGTGNLSVQGSLYTASGGLSGSDKRLKENINSVSEDEKNKLLQLNAQTYNYIDDDDKRKRYGYIAQDVEKLYPNIVKENDKGMKSVNYDDFIPLAIENIKDLKRTIPNNKQVCIDGVCLTKEDILKLKNL
jgi:hypothetical protein